MDDEHVLRIEHTTTIRDDRVAVFYRWTCSCGASSGFDFNGHNGARYGHIRHTRDVVAS